MNSNSLILIGGRKKISASSILMLKADCNYTIIYLHDGSTIYSSTNLSKIGSRLKNLDFFQPNRSFIINLNFIKAYENETAQIEMQNDEAISVSRRKTKNFVNKCYPFFSK